MTEAQHMPLISVIMPAYNCEKYIGEAIESVLQQTYYNFELIVINDCSADATLSIIQHYADKDHRVKLIDSKKNHGVAITRNSGIHDAKGEYIALLDSDDVWDQEKLKNQLKLIADSGAQLTYCSYDFIDEQGSGILKPFIVPIYTDYSKMLRENVISCSTVFIRAEVLKSRQFKSDIYHEDYLMWMEMLRDGVTATGDSHVLTHYRIVKGSRSNNKINAAKRRWDVYRRGLNLSLFKSLNAFGGYTLNGIIKYKL